MEPTGDCLGTGNVFDVRSVVRANVSESLESVSFSAPILLCGAQPDPLAGGGVVYQRGTWTILAFLGDANATATVTIK